jgi:3-methylcrotonyl-CoA carboxylase alpha subunit
MITGVDIVKEQIAIAGGMPLSINAKSIQRKGHAIEARIFAEDPENDLLPSPGKIGYYGEPSFRGLRIESAVSSGSVISPDYDPLIAKVLVHAGDRDKAIRELGRALESFVITGVQHNIPLIRAILIEENFRNNLVSTTYLNERIQEFSQDIKMQRSNMPHDMLALAATIRVVTPDFSSMSKSPWQSIGYWRTVPRLTLRIDNRFMEVVYYHNNPGSMDFYIQDKCYHAKEIFMDDHHINFWHENAKYTFYYLRRPDGTIEVSDGMLNYVVERSYRLLDEEITAELAEHDNGDGVIRTPLPGKVIRLHARINDMVGRGDPLLVIESMKLENSILATCKGKILDIRIKEGDLVKKNDILLVIHNS